MVAVKANADTTGGEILFLGNPHLYFTWRDVSVLATSLGLAPPLRVGGEVNLSELTNYLGFECFETAGLEGDTTIQLDLTQDLPAFMRNRFRLVVDAGVLYWCFDPAKAIRNIFDLTSVGGAVLHVTSLSGFFGRGYYSIQPRMLDDFYASNGATRAYASWRRRPSQAVVKKIYRKLPFICRRIALGGDCSAIEEGSYFLARSGYLGKLKFAKFDSGRPVRWIPNDVLGTYVYVKNLDTLAVSRSVLLERQIG